MAISPNLLDEKFMNEVSLFERAIDRKLSTLKVSAGGSVNVDPPNTMTSTHFSILKNRYLEAGWKDVVWNSDQREGDWLSFKA